MKIGLRIPGACAKLPLPLFAAWCREAGFDALDLGGPANLARAQTVRDAGLEVGTIDLGGTQKLLSPDEAVRKEGIEICIANVEAIAEAGADKAFCVFYPQDTSQSRRASFEHWQSAFPAVIREAERRGVRIAVEGWPGPNNSALGVTPETLRALFAAVPSDHFGINYDPSHLVRVGVDYKRYLAEFAKRIVHVHGKDTALDPESLYRYGNLGPTFDQTVGFSGGDWRYAIPGEGSVDWPHVCASLHQNGFDGVLSLELEDFRYNGSEDGEKRGLTRARAYLTKYL
ncbi:MAG: sugar phosphate isomerase/epimerase [Cytophagales bacterium]|nr:sugar phosphate isomerase/epimerase [Armatimonadota bacterium]